MKWIITKRWPNAPSTEQRATLRIFDSVEAAQEVKERMEKVMPYRTFSIRSFGG